MDIFEKLKKDYPKLSKKNVSEIRCVPFRKNVLRGELSYQILSKKLKPLVLVEVPSISCRAESVIREMRQYQDFDFVIYSDTECEGVIGNRKFTFTASPVITKKLKPESHTNFFTPQREWLLKYIIYTTFGCLDWDYPDEIYRANDLVKYCDVPASNASVFLKLALKQKYLVMDSRGVYIPRDFKKLIRAWSHHPPYQYSTWVKCAYDSDPEETIMKIMKRYESSNVISLGSYLSCKKMGKYIVNKGWPELYYGDNLNDFIIDNNLWNVEEKSENSFCIKKPVNNNYFFKACKKVEGVKLIDPIQWCLDLVNDIRGEEQFQYLKDLISKDG